MSVIMPDPAVFPLQRLPFVREIVTLHQRVFRRVSLSLRNKQKMRLRLMVFLSGIGTLESTHCLVGHEFEGRRSYRTRSPQVRDPAPGPPSPYLVPSVTQLVCHTWIVPFLRSRLVILLVHVRYPKETEGQEMRIFGGLLTLLAESLTTAQTAPPGSSIP